MSQTAMSIFGDTLGDVIYRMLGDDSDQMEKEVYALNPHLSRLPVQLPVGTLVTLPEIKPVKENESKRVITVWD
ncbi:tail protein X [Vibrio fluvialis]|uniref:tail protein X n=1 Tax=Vibrio fluvialis TaxID=676 RepID=UPI001C9C98A3|nr:tail protein X [Vibrio fluvialis]MBY7925031.1 tail protein X [Vibrio fluvialis]MBY7980824.1 tail protein X [Vibrio fluvialis]MBY8233187.1 tail protein X [Vibrio fluvialis]